MSKFPIFVILALVILTAELATPALAARPVKPVTVNQLAQILAQARGQKDKKVARELSGLRLTQRISTPRLEQWETEFPGKHVRQALTELSDASAFLALPPSDVPRQAPPDVNSLQHILLRSIAYVNKTLRRLPNFFALRTTAHYEDKPAFLQDRQPLCSNPSLHAVCLSEASELGTSMAFHNTPLIFAGESHATVTYVDGKEVDNGHSVGAAPPSNPQTGLVTSGEFGPILTVVLGDAVRGQVYWGYWEQGASGLLTVFRYSVPAAKSHYLIALPSGVSTESIKTAYHGEIAIDPAKGTIFRITVVADPRPPHKQIETSLMVQYGSVVIGGKPYICPVKGVATSRMPAQFKFPSERASQPLLITRLNDITFTRYHLFRADIKVLPGNGSHSAAHAPQEPQTLGQSTPMPAIK